MVAYCYQELTCVDRVRTDSCASQALHYLPDVISKTPARWKQDGRLALLQALAASAEQLDDAVPSSPRPSREIIDHLADALVGWRKTSTARFLGKLLLPDSSGRHVLWCVM